MINNPTVGQHVYFYEQWSDRPVGATIQEINGDIIEVKWACNSLN